MQQQYPISADITRAHTLPASFYKSTAIYEAQKEQVFAKSWQMVGNTHDLDGTKNCFPFRLFPDYLEEPLVLTRDKNEVLHCLSNVCTHRGNLLVEESRKSAHLSCKYHGRCFHLDGKFRSMPMFTEAQNFPMASDNLPELALAKLGSLLFTSLDPSHDFSVYFNPIKNRLSWFPFDQLKEHETYTKTYYVNANWALYCDNYLEGFHVPFVHPTLNQALDFGSYSTEIFDYCNLQLGIAKPNEVSFDLPPSSVDYGKSIYAYYFWVFPNMMFNFYPWGLSLNIVQPIAINKTRIIFKTYLLEGHSAEEFANTAIDATELEDEAIVESVQIGMQSRLYQSGRFSPKMEQGVHHFHRLLSQAMH